MISHILCILMETVAMASIKRWNAVSNYSRLIPIFSVVIGGVMVDLNCRLCQKHWEENDEPSPQHTANATCSLCLFIVTLAHTHTFWRSGDIRRGPNRRRKLDYRLIIWHLWYTCAPAYSTVSVCVYKHVCVCVCVCGATAAGSTCITV